jgi:hypothetical protein
LGEISRVIEDSRLDAFLPAEAGEDRVQATARRSWIVNNL